MAKYIISKAVEVIITLICLVVLGFIIMMILGFRPYVVLSGSMENKIHTGSLCFVDTGYKYENLKVGDIIAYTNGKIRVTHRIHKIENGLIQTKGDANEEPDKYLIGEEHFVGLTKYWIPAVGYAVNWMQTEKGKILTCTAVIALILLNFLVHDNSHEQKNDEKVLMC